MKEYTFTRKELEEKGAYEYEEGDVVVCNKYRVWIRYGTFDCPKMHTRVSMEGDMGDLPMSKHPKYIREFIEREE